jgi:hypothetical protein
MKIFKSQNDMKEKIEDTRPNHILQSACEGLQMAAPDTREWYLYLEIIKLYEGYYLGE